MFVKMYNKLKQIIIDFVSYIKRKLIIKKIDESLITNIEWIKEYNIPIKRFYEKKPEWISGVARLKNAEHFLELCMESHLPFLDELILVDNQSTDNTKKICKNLEKKYPNKIKFFEYPYPVLPPSDNNKDMPTNSIHSLAYYYNWCFSKAKYNHVMKVDDDNFLIAEKFQKIREQSLNSKKFNTYRWLNLIKDWKWKIWVPKWYEYSWRYWDIWIYPVSPYTYYIQWKSREVFVNNLRIKRNGFSYLHLKFLKPNYWFWNLLWDNYQKRYESKVTTNEFVYDFKTLIWKNENTEINKYIKTII